jgi:hypothetical protein
MRRADFEPGLEFFDRLTPTEQSRVSRTILIGPFAIRLQGLEPAVIAPLEDRYLGFVEEADSPRALRVPVRHAGVSAFLARFGDAQGRYLMKTRYESGKILVYGHDFAGWFDPLGKEGRLAVCGSGWEAAQVPVENFLRLYCAWRVTDAGGLLLHAASIVRGGRAYIFCGHSGAGKSTVSALSSDLGFVLSDDLTMVMPGPDGYLAHSVPFRSIYKGRVVAERRTYPVAGIYGLVQSKRNIVHPLSGAQAVAAVLASLPFVTDRLLPRDPSQLMHLLTGIVGRIPVFKLEFTRSAEFWNEVLTAT